MITRFDPIRWLHSRIYIVQSKQINILHKCIKKILHVLETFLEYYLYFRKYLDLYLELSDFCK